METPKEAGLERILWLGHMCTANSAPITDDQVERFGIYPDFCLSDGCLEVQRVDSPILKGAGLVLSPNGQPTYVAVNHSRDPFTYRIVCERQCLLSRQLPIRQVIGFSGDRIVAVADTAASTTSIKFML